MYARFAQAPGRDDQAPEERETLQNNRRTGSGGRDMTVLVRYARPLELHKQEYVCERL